MAQFCEVNIVCRSATDVALATVAKAVARMTYVIGADSFLCTGTLLNPRSGSLIPYFYSANHCISTQTVASTLTLRLFTLFSRTKGFDGVFLLRTREWLLFSAFNASPSDCRIHTFWSSLALQHCGPAGLVTCFPAALSRILGAASGGLPAP